MSLLTPSSYPAPPSTASLPENWRDWPTTHKRALAHYLIHQRQTPGAAEALGLLAWTQRNRRELAPGRLFDLSAHPYLREIYTCPARDMVVRKASQVGVTEYAISYALHAADVRGATVLYVFPTDTHVSDFSTARVGPAIEASAYLSGIVRGEDEAGVRQAGRRGADRVTLKRVRDRFLYLRGAMVKNTGQAPQLKSIDADVLILDEVDEMDPRAPTIAGKRLGHSQIAERRYISTPSLPGFGIDEYWQASDQREWCLPCPACGKRQHLTIGHIVQEWDELERPIAWHGRGEGRAYAACQHCGKELDRAAAGEWVAMAAGEMAGFHPTRLMMPHVNLLEIVIALQSVDQSRRKEAYNQDLGLPYKPRGTGIDSAQLDSCRAEYAHGPRPGEICVMGVDVGRALHCVIRGPAHEETGERPQRFAGEVVNFETLADLMRRYRVRTCVIDALPETRKVREFQQAHRAGQVWLAYYTQGEQGTQDVTPTRWVADQGVVKIDRTRLLDETLARFMERVNSLPAHARDIPGYYEHLCAPVRAERRQANGVTVAVYVETGPDHFAHAENYCTAAASAPRAPVGVLVQGKVKHPATHS